jgi:hypothetical protein
VKTHQHQLVTDHRTLPTDILNHLGIENPYTVETVYDPEGGWRIAVVTAEGNHLIICDEKVGIVTVYR